MPPFQFFPQVYTRKKKLRTSSTAAHDQLPAGAASGNPLPMASLSNTQSPISIPSTYEEASRHSGWMAAIQEEMAPLLLNKTWDLTSLPSGKKVVGCKWVFTVKYKPDGSVERLKAIFVAKGYSQTYGVDYHETFSPVAKLKGRIFKLGQRWSCYL